MDGGVDGTIDAVAQAVVGLGEQEQMSAVRAHHHHHHHHAHQPNEEAGVNDGATYPQQFEGQGP